jgi:hypothetical protein
MFREYDSFNGEELSAPRPTLKLEDHSLSAVRYYLFNIFAATFHISGHSSTRNQGRAMTRCQEPTYHGSGHIRKEKIFPLQASN